VLKNEFLCVLGCAKLEIWDPPTGPPFESEVKETVYDYTFFDDVPSDELTD
jgi:hypothetical protein